MSTDYQYILDQGHLPYMLPPSGFVDLTLDNQHVLEQAALILNRPLDALLDFSNQQHLELTDQPHFHKRLRLDTGADIQMPALFSSAFSLEDGQEKLPLGGDPGAAVHGSRKAYAPFPERTLSSGWTGTRLADCFASFSMCPPFESQPCMCPYSCCPCVSREANGTLTASSAYQPLLTPTSYDYDSHRPHALDTAVISIQPQGPSSLLSTPVTASPTALFSCDDPALMAQYLSGYPPLQPERTMGFQPAIMSREEMVYPSMSPAVKYESDTASPHGTSGLGTQPLPYLVDTTGHAAAMPVAYAAGGETLPYDGHGIVMSLPSRLHSVPGFDAGPGPENAGVREESAILDFLPAHRTAPVKRGPFKDQDLREKTAFTRKMGSCIRCRMQRIRVSHGLPP